MHHQEIQDMEANKDVDIEKERSLPPAWTLLAQGDHLLGLCFVAEGLRGRSGFRLKLFE